MFIHSNSHKLTHQEKHRPNCSQAETVHFGILKVGRGVMEEGRMGGGGGGGERECVCVCVGGGGGAHVVYTVSCVTSPSKTKE